jgi:enolase-phosphatase E1
MIKAIVTDIEGTTSSLSFVKDVLFPYARARIADFVRQHAEDPQVAPLIADVCREAGAELTIDGVIAKLIQWIDEDRKIGALKAIQGLLWEAGYRNGDFKGHIYADAKHRLEEWRAQGIKLYVYSSGSVYAQKLLFGHTDYGDINHLFDGNFDTGIGAKIDASAYRRIVDELQLAPDEILFLSDVESELDAAKSAGMNTVWLLRDGEPDHKTSHRQVADFSSIEIG